jgi:integrase/recombinase XerD
MTKSLAKAESQSLAPSALTPSQAIVTAYLNRYKASSLKTKKKYLGMLVDLMTPQRSTPRRKSTPEEMNTRILSFDWLRIDRDFVTAVNRKAKDRQYSASTRLSLLIACRGIAEELEDKGFITVDQLYRIKKVGERDAKRGERKKKSKSISDDDLLKILRACLVDEKRLRGLRDFAILTLVAGSGIRAQEAVNLRVKDLSFTEGSITVTGKGDNERVVYVVDGVMEALRRWLENYSPVDGVLFPAFAPQTDEPIKDRAGTPMSYQAFYDLVRKRAIEVGVQPPTPHWFRHTFATKTYLATEDLFAVQMQLGHQDERTTRGYINEVAEDSAKRRAAKSWKLPDV